MKPAFRWLLVAAFSMLQVGNAVADSSEEQIKELDNKCEQAREAKLKPLRDAEIAKCKTNKPDDPEYCERFWRDFGDGYRLQNGGMKPRMFNDLPECVAAFKARKGRVID